MRPRRPTVSHTLAHSHNQAHIHTRLPCEAISMLLAENLLIAQDIETAAIKHVSMEDTSIFMRFTVATEGEPSRPTVWQQAAVHSYTSCHEDKE